MSRIIKSDINFDIDLGECGHDGYGNQNSN